MAFPTPQLNDDDGCVLLASPAPDRGSQPPSRQQALLPGLEWTLASLLLLEQPLQLIERVVVCQEALLQHQKNGLLMLRYLQ